MKVLLLRKLGQVVLGVEQRQPSQNWSVHEVSHVQSLSRSQNEISGDQNSVVVRQRVSQAEPLGLSAGSTVRGRREAVDGRTALDKRRMRTL